jgi:tetratricopeptide (TPR) repeat protein
MSERYGGYGADNGVGGAGNGYGYDSPTEPTGEAADWYRQGVQLLEDGNPAAAAQLLTRVAQKTPESASVLEALARAHFDGGDYEDAVDSFAQLANVSPNDDYAQFGWGLAAAKLGQMDVAVEHLSAAAAMRPEIRHYANALRAARSTLREQSGKRGLADK